LKDDRYEEVQDPDWMLRRVFDFGASRGDIVRRNEWVDDDRVDWAPVAARFGIAPERSLHVVRHAGLCWRESEFVEDWYGDPRFVFLGPDADWSPLEVIATMREDDLLMIIHARPLREMWQCWYAEAARWER
jgi:hypothetical protein